MGPSDRPHRRRSRPAGPPRAAAKTASARSRRSICANASVGFDWRRTEGEEWTITVRTVDGHEVRLEGGGSRLSIDGKHQPTEGLGEYPDIYREFVELIDERRSHVDVAPLRLVADCLLASERGNAARNAVRDWARLESVSPYDPKAREGVRVSVIYDAVGSFAADRSMFVPSSRDASYRSR